MWPTGEVPKCFLRDHIFHKAAGVVHPERIVELLLLLAAANGTPVLAKRLFGAFLAYPLNGGRSFLDGRPLFGSSKTIRGIATSIVATAWLALLLGTAITTGLVIGVIAMVFVKRRLGGASTAGHSAWIRPTSTMCLSYKCRTPRRSLSHGDALLDAR
jgi:hypothetical protein